MSRNWSPGRPLPLWDRFWRHVDPNGPVPASCPELGPCWLWTAKLNHLGYGRFFLTSDTPRLSAPPHRWRSPDGRWVLTWGELYALLDDLPGNDPRRELLARIMDGDAAGARDALKGCERLRDHHAS